MGWGKKEGGVGWEKKKGREGYVEPSDFFSCSDAYDSDRRYFHTTVRRQYFRNRNCDKQEYFVTGILERHVNTSHKKCFRQRTVILQHRSTLQREFYDEHFVRVNREIVYICKTKINLSAQVGYLISNSTTSINMQTD